MKISAVTEELFARLRFLVYN